MKIAFPTDEHFPFQDERARRVALEIVCDFNPDLRISGSDGLDFYHLSSFDHNPERAKVHQQDEIDRWRAGQREWQSAAPNARAFFLVGNHEDRLRRYLWRHPEIAQLDAVRLPNLLGLESLGIPWEWNKGERANRELDLGPLLIKHGQYVRKFSGLSARAELEAEFHAVSILSGHTHRGGVYYASTRSGIVQSAECFCLCRLDPEYIQHPNWQQGIVLVELTGGTVSIESIPIHTLSGQKRAVWRGKEYRAG